MQPPDTSRLVLLLACSLENGPLADDHQQDRPEGEAEAHPWRWLRHASQSVCVLETRAEHGHATNGRWNFIFYLKKL